MEEEEKTEEKASSEPSPQEKKKKKKLIPGVVYLSRIPPYMKPHKLRCLLAPYGKLGNIYLQPEDESVRKRRIKNGGSRKRNFTEGWVEFADKRVARAIAMALNNVPIGGRKRNYYHDDIWNMKYLPHFRWSHLGEKKAYERAVEDQQVQLEMSQAKREIKVYMDHVSKSKEIDAIVTRKKKRRAAREEEKGEEEDGVEEMEEDEDEGRKEVLEGEKKRVYQFEYKQRKVFGVTPTDPSECLYKLTRPSLSDTLLRQVYPSQAGASSAGDQ